MAEMAASPLRISCTFPVFDVGKPHGMGAGAHDAREIEFLSTVSADISDRARGISVGKRPIEFLAAVITFSGVALTL
jgi:hypothetical protein